MADWQNRIVGHGEEVPDQLLANPMNWRVHPKAQQDALGEVLDKVGWVQSVIVNQRTGHVVDGHLRVALAISREEAAIPVVYVDLSEAEEKLVLASLDPLGQMAVTDEQILAELRQDVVDEGEVIAGTALAELLRIGVAVGGYNVGNNPTQDQIDRRSLALDGEFAERARLRALGLVGVTCPDCGHEFAVDARQIAAQAAGEPTSLGA